MINYLEVDSAGLAIGGVYSMEVNATPPSTWIKLEEGVSLGWVWDGVTWTAPSPKLVFVEELREERDKRLTASDFSQLPDTPLTEEARTTWRSYRQSLRDLPENYIPVESPEWPQINI